MNIFQKVTLKNLKENRTRTLVTIVGIILSAAMFTAVTTSISSLREYLIQSTIYSDGSWYGAAHNLTSEQIEDIMADEEIDSAVTLELMGFVSLPDSINEYKPYLCVYGVQSDFTDLMPVQITEGRMPENSSEILLPNHLKTNGGIRYELNDVLTLDLGNRMTTDGYILSNQTPYIEPVISNESSLESATQDSELQDTSTEPNAQNDVLQDPPAEPDTQNEVSNIIPSEIIEVSESRTYTVVGFYNRPSFEDYSAPGYTALTAADENKEHTFDIYFRTISGKNTFSYMNERFSNMETLSEKAPSVSWEMNYSLLRLYGYSGESNYNRVLYGLASILIGIIMFGSISLIYNAFSISVSERTRQYGLLASIGATRRQLTGSVLFEAVFLSIIGIPLGILSGLLGIGITFFFTGDMISRFLGLPSDMEMMLYPSLEALAIAVLISFVTVLISAYIPARRSMKKSAIDAIRQTNDISIRSKKVKTSRLTQKLFGFEGMIATKNYKRNRRKYRATVISLFLSIVLFISASSWCAYLTKSAGDVYSVHGYDIAYRFHPEFNPTCSLEELMTELSAVDGISNAVYASSLYLPITIGTEDIDKTYLDFQQTPVEYDTFDVYSCIYFVEDDAFKAYLTEQNLPESVFYDSSNPTAIAFDKISIYNGEDSKYHNYSVLSKDSLQAAVNLPRDIGSFTCYGEYSIDENGNIFYSYYNEETNEQKDIPKEEAIRAIPLNIGSVQSEIPFYLPSSTSYPLLIYPYSFLEQVFNNLEEDVTYGFSFPSAPLSENISTTFYFQCEDHTKAVADMTTLLNDKSFPVSSLNDYAENVESERAMITVINVFSYGFITLISLIAAANVFNTISTNINLRRREFAMLKSIGMTPKGFRKMMNFECLLYGFKGLLYGLPVSFFVTWLIYRAVSNGLVAKFFIPWSSIAIAVGSVFIVVFATMLYSMSKIKKENTIDELKNENL